MISPENATEPVWCSAALLHCSIGKGDVNVKPAVGSVHGVAQANDESRLLRGSCRHGVSADILALIVRGAVDPGVSGSREPTMERLIACSGREIWAYPSVTGARQSTPVQG